MKIYKYEDYVISQDEKTESSIVAQEYNFYKVDKSLFEELFDKNEIKFVKKIADNFLYTIFMVLTIIFTIALYFEKSDFMLISVDFIQATMILILNVFIHEFGHIIFLKLFYKESRIKVGFKFVFIYPAFYVDTSYSYLLPKYKRIAVYLAGNFTNCLFVLGVVFFYPELLSYCYLVISNLLINFIPVVKSDGYYACIAFLNKTNKKLDKKMEVVDDFIRGMGMFIILSILSYI